MPPSTGDDDATRDDGDELDDELEEGSEGEAEESSPSAAEPRRVTLALDDAEIERRLRDDPASLGSMSLGRPNAGALLEAVQLPEGEHWVRVDAANAWGTRETIESLTHCIDAVATRYPETPRVHVGHVSARGGGHLSPHKSHQAGRDVDVGYYTTPGAKWYARADAKNLDRARTWSLIRALLVDTDVELILVDTSIQTLLKEHALAIGEDRAWVDSLFQVGNKGGRAIIRHAKGHATHLHVRFYSPIAQETARRAYPTLVKLGKVPTSGGGRSAAAAPGYVEHRAKSGDTLGSLANRYKTTVQAIQRANNLRSTRLEARHVYRIPTGAGYAMLDRDRDRPRGPAAPPPVVVLPPRRLPPASSHPGGASAAGPVN